MKKDLYIPKQGDNPPKNAGYWKRKCKVLENANEVLFKRVKELEGRG